MDDFFRLIDTLGGGAGAVLSVTAAMAAVAMYRRSEMTHQELLRSQDARIKDLEEAKEQLLEITRKTHDILTMLKGGGR